MKQPVRVTVTGAAGQIGYALMFRIASGAMLGNDQPVILQMLEITPALGALDGVIMELEDCAFPLVHGMIPTDDPNVAFKGTDYALLVGSRPRSKGMERKDLIEANAAIFSVQGKALNDHASRQSEDPRCRQPGEHELSDRATQRAGPEPASVHRDDAPRSQPCGGATRQEDR